MSSWESFGHLVNYTLLMDWVNKLTIGDLFRVCCNVFTIKMRTSAHSNEFGILLTQNRISFICFTMKYFFSFWVGPIHVRFHMFPAKAINRFQLNMNLWHMDPTILIFLRKSYQHFTNTVMLNLFHYILCSIKQRHRSLKANRICSYACYGESNTKIL